MTEEEFKEKMNKDLNEIFDAKSFMNLWLDLVQKAYTKGLDTGFKAGMQQTTTDLLK